MFWFYILIFIISCLIIFWAGNFLIESLMRTAKFLGWREFVVSFFVMAMAGSIPNLFVGLSSAFQGIPQLSFGDIMGGNLIDLTLVVALAALIGKGIKGDSRLIQTSAIFTAIAAVLPLFLVFDGSLGRGDGFALILMFIFYIFWLFSKQERFTKEYNDSEEKPVREFKAFMGDVGKIVLGIFLLLLAAQGIVVSARFFALAFNIPLAIIGILIVGLGNALPETYFAVVSAERKQTWMVLGDLMGAVVVASTFVLGLVALVHPIQIPDFSPFAVARFFLVVAAIFFFFFLRTDREITKKEALFLLGIYIVFIVVEILIR